MFKVKQNDIFAKNMSKSELYQTTKMSKMEQAEELFNECGFQYKEKAHQEMDKFINKLVKKNGTTNY